HTMVVTYQDMQAGQLASQLRILLPDVPVLRLPPRDFISGADAASLELLSRRAAVLHAMTTQENYIVVAGVEALQYRLVPCDVWCDMRIGLHPGDVVEPDDLCMQLAQIGYERVDQVEGIGQFARRGGIIDIFSVGMEEPYRVEFFDDEVDSIRAFDPISQRSEDMLDECIVLPANEVRLAEKVRERAVKKAEMLIKKAMEESEGEEERLTGYERLSMQLARGRQEELLFAVSSAKRAMITDYLGEKAKIVVDEPTRTAGRMDQVSEHFALRLTESIQMGSAVSALNAISVDTTALFTALSKFIVLNLHAFERTGGRLRPKAIVRMQTRNVVSTQSRLVFLAEQMGHWCREGCRVLLFAADAKSAQDLQSDLEGYDLPIGTGRGYVEIVPNSLGAGAEYPDEKLVFVSLRETLSSQPLKKRKSVHMANAKRITDFSDLVVGEAVVHDQHGIARYDGIVQMEVDGKRRDYLRLSFAGTDVLYVPTDQMDRVQKYIGSEEGMPKLSKLGGTQWAKTRAKVKAGVKDMTEELAKLYAARSLEKGFAFSEDTPWQREFESEFPYEETPDQLTSIEEIKRDMQSPQPMDRLLLGDVGYGKTEVALRAAFKAVNDSKQVAILVPTTLLAQQHYETIRRRFEHFPVKVQVLSRFRTPTQQRAILRDVADGRIDIVVGTHRLLAKDVIFANLGLLIIDEEQRFGVEHKEKIRQMKKNVDVLTLSATPIPRTLHMSMTGIRDMSVIETPPSLRTPVQTYVLEYSDGIVRDAIMRELSRDGQVYIIYNKVQSIEGFASRIRSLIPDLRVAVGHGQMPENRLEEVMQDFIDGQYDVLVCTTIAENGIDIPNANTLIVYEADRFGLSQLYQLRGRVGRSRRTAYAYFTYMRDSVMSETAHNRLSAISEYTQFGSGFKIALRDLQIRGAGNLLGAQQHGHLASVGYEMYCRMVQEAIAQIKNGEAEKPLRPDPHLDLSVEAFIPDFYIENQMLKIQAYQTIAAIDGEEAREDVTEELIDRYGDMPDCVQTLIDVAYLKHLARKCGVTRIMHRGTMAEIFFAPDAPVDPERLLALVSSSKGRITFRGGVVPQMQYNLDGDLFEKLGHVMQSIVAEEKKG
ncbi:MAG: transcription-repair coupling factor, partial [Clostridia bacterium]|nr:transcription-repair coupling factor [Clostridia bacterium]